MLLALSSLPVLTLLNNTELREHKYSSHFQIGFYEKILNTLKSLTKEFKPLGVLYFKNMEREMTWRLQGKNKKVRMKVLIWKNNLPEIFRLKKKICFNQLLVLGIFFKT